jgi:hypothetical protein
MNPVTRISPASDAEAGQLARGETLAHLAAQITAMPVAGPSARPGRAGRAPGHASGRGPARRRLLIALPAAAALAVAGLVATSLGSPGQKIGPVSVGPAKAQAAVLSFTRHGGYLDVIVKNPLADARKYRAEFAKYGLDISLRLVPASPSLVGTLVYAQAPTSGPTITPITAVGRCFTGGAGNVCPVGVKVPLDFKGQAELVFGRAARPGEPYETTAAANAPGEIMHGMTYSGKTVTHVLAMLRARHATAGRYMVTNSSCENTLRRTAPGNWFVDSADPWSPGQVMLTVSPTWPAQQCVAPPSPGATPTPTPTSHAG